MKSELFFLTNYLNLLESFSKQVLCLSPKFFSVALISRSPVFFIDEFYASNIAKMLYLHLNVDFLVDILALDKLVMHSRFSIIHLFRLILSKNFFFTLKCGVGSTSNMLSISQLIPAALVAEREIWDLFGLYFSQHSDLRRILTDYGFQGHPFLRDYPLAGYLEVRYDHNLQRVVTEPIELAQEFRDFDFINPWVG